MTFSLQSLGVGYPLSPHRSTGIPHFRRSSYLPQKHFLSPIITRVYRNKQMDSPCVRYLLVLLQRFLTADTILVTIRGSLKQPLQGELLHFDVKEMWRKWVGGGRKWRWKYDYKSGTIVWEVRASPSLFLQTTSEMFHDLKDTYLRKRASAFFKPFSRRRWRDFYCHVTVAALGVWGYSQSHY
jgi:hypothetical protein